MKDFNAPDATHLEIADLLGISPQEVSHQILTRSVRILDALLPAGSDSPEDRWLERFTSEPLATYALKNGLSDDEVIAQARAEKGPAWDYAVRERDSYLQSFSQAALGISELVKNTKRAATLGLVGNLDQLRSTVKSFESQSIIGSAGVLGSLGKVAAAGGAIDDITESVRAAHRHTTPDRLDDFVAQATWEREERERAWRDSMLSSLMDLNTGIGNLYTLTGEDGARLYALTDTAIVKARASSRWTISLLALTLVVVVAEVLLAHYWH